MDSSPEDQEYYRQIDAVMEGEIQPRVTGNEPTPHKQQQQQQQQQQQ